MTFRWLGVIALAVVCFAGCADDEFAPVPSGTIAEPVGVQLLRLSPELKNQRFSTMLNFELPVDSVFVQTRGIRSSMDSSLAHTGHGSLRLDGKTGELTVKLSSLLGGRAFPGGWTTAGAFFLSDRPSHVTVSCFVGQTRIASETTTLLPSQWTEALVDITGQLAPPGAPALVFAIDSPDAVWCDDVILIDNTQWIFGDPHSAAAGWSISRRGFNFVCEVPNKFATRLLTAEARPDGWSIQESNEMRARFTSDGSVKTLTIWSDGRSYWDGVFKPLSEEFRSDPSWEKQESSPAEIQIPQEMGRLDRRSSGDVNNDGYNEFRGTYMIAATGPRLDVTFVPRSVPIMRPILEIAGLPAGKALVTIEGRLIEKTFRLDDGTLLVEVPARIDRSVTVNVRVQ
ncbi:MAG TPA: hypothetical protein VHD56_01615 [Tepidisphaeraceae bacterium]|nr:hypothetical protein [Tepidisphaeraceae bacterium]